MHSVSDSHYPLTYYYRSTLLWYWCQKASEKNAISARSPEVDEKTLFD